MSQTPPAGEPKRRGKATNAEGAEESSETVEKRGPLSVLLGKGNRTVANPWSPIPERFTVVEIDGHHAMVADVERGALRSYRHVSEKTQGAALQSALDDVNRRTPVLVSIAGAGVQARRLPDFPRLPDQAVSAAFAARATSFATSGQLSVAGRILGIGGHRSAVVAAVESSRLEPLWDVADKFAQLSITAAPLRFVDDGVFLAMRYGAAEVTWVADGAVLFHRALSGGGLDGLHEDLNDSSGPGTARVEAVIRNMAQADVEALAAVEEYVAEVVAETRATVTQWATSSSQPIPDTIYVFGPGAALPTLRQRLINTGFVNPQPPPLPPGVSFDDVPEAERFGAWSAVAAAKGEITAGWELFVNEAVARSTLARAAAARRATNVARAVAVSIVTIAVLVVPTAVATLDKNKATSERDNTRVQIAREAQWEAIGQAVAAREGQTAGLNEARWKELMLVIRDTIPPGGTLGDLTFAVGADGVTISVSATLADPGARFADVSQWIRTITTALGVPPVVPNFEHGEQGGATTQFSIVVPLTDARWFGPKTEVTP